MSIVWEFWQWSQKTIFTLVSWFIKINLQLSSQANGKKFLKSSKKFAFAGKEHIMKMWCESQQVQQRRTPWSLWTWLKEYLATMRVIPRYPRSTTSNTLSNSHEADVQEVTDWQSEGETKWSSSETLRRLLAITKDMLLSPRSTTSNTLSKFRVGRRNRMWGGS